MILLDSITRDSIETLENFIRAGELSVILVDWRLVTEQLIDEFPFLTRTDELEYLIDSTKKYLEQKYPRLTIYTVCDKSEIPFDLAIKISYIIKNSAKVQKLPII